MEECTTKPRTIIEVQPNTISLSRAHGGLSCLNAEEVNGKNSSFPQSQLESLLLDQTWIMLEISSHLILLNASKLSSCSLDLLYNLRLEGLSLPCASTMPVIGIQFTTFEMLGSIQSAIACNI